MKKADLQVGPDSLRHPGKLLASQAAMHRKPPPRLDSANYIGLHAYFLTICVEGRRAAFSDVRMVTAVIEQLRQCSASYEFAVIAYCFMPDHAHLLVEGLSDRSDFQEFVRVWKQRTAFAAKRDRGITLWQRGYFEHVLRSDESLEQKARYLLENPVRAGLVASPQDYQWMGPSRRRSKTCFNALRSALRHRSKDSRREDSLRRIT